MFSKTKYNKHTLIRHLEIYKSLLIWAKGLKLCLGPHRLLNQAKSEQSSAYVCLKAQPEDMHKLNHKFKTKVLIFD